MTTRSRQEIEDRMENGLKEFLAVIDHMSDEEMTGPVDSNGWNVRDHLTHLAVWADGIAALVQRQDRWAAMGLEKWRERNRVAFAYDMADPDQEPEYDPLNAEIVAKHRHLTPHKARTWLIEAHQAVAAALRALPDEELGWPYDRFVAPFTGDRGEPMSEYILGNTEDHYEEHAPWMRAIAEGTAG
jgi:hypothetical protein